MNHILISLYFLIFSCNTFGQQIQKKTIYLEFKLDENCSRKQKFFNEIENGIVFNLFCDKNGSFLYKGISDTLSISKLKNYNLLNIGEVEKLENKW